MTIAGKEKLLDVFLMTWRYIVRDAANEKLPTSLDLSQHEARQGEPQVMRHHLLHISQHEARHGDPRLMRSLH